MKFDRWIKKIRATENEEISCSECFDLVSDYVDAELAGGEMSGTMKRVKHHLEMCKACQDEYEMLRDLVMKDAGEESSPDQE
jgi:predicted anti-sigma-YlaC factor YlaD